MFYHMSCMIPSLYSFECERGVAHNPTLESGGTLLALHPVLGSILLHPNTTLI